MKILIVCQYYYPENFQITPIAEALVEDGYDVTVLTGLPNYPLGIVPDEYKHGHRDEIINGVRVIRCFEIGRSKGAFHLGLNYLSFMFSSLAKIRKIQKDYDLVMCYQLSPVLMGVPAMVFSRKYKTPFLLYCCDLWPESLKIYLKNESNPLYGLVGRVSKKIYSSADRIICQSKSFIRYFERVHGISAKKMTYIPAFADPTYLSQDFENDNGIADFVFLGNLGLAQNLDSIIEAAALIKDVPGFKLHFVGDGACADRIKALTSEKELDDKIIFYGRRPVEEMPDFYRLADVCIVSLKADNETGYTLPSKVQGYMAAGKPILGMIEGSAAEVIKDAECGACVASGDVEGFARIMKDYIENKEKYSDCGSKGREYFVDNFMKEGCIALLEKEMEQLVRN